MAMKHMAAAILSPLLKLFEVLLAIALFLIIILTFADVVGRYFFAKPIFGAAEMIEFLLAAAIFIGLLMINVLDEHIAVDMFEHHIIARIPRIHAIVVHGAALLIMSIIAWQFTLRAIEDIEQNSRTVVLEWPLYWITAAIALLSFLAVICQVLSLIAGQSSHHEAAETLRGIE